MMIRRERKVAILRHRLLARREQPSRFSSERSMNRER